MEQLKVDITKLRTKSAYAAELGVTPAAVDKMLPAPHKASPPLHFQVHILTSALASHQVS